MIVFIKADGTPLNVVTSPVYQGSQLNGSLYLVAPYSATNAVTVNFTLPNGDLTETYLLTPINAIEGVETEKLEGYSIWEWQANNKKITEYAGKVTAQLSVLYPDEQVQTTASVDFTVLRGSIPLPPQEPTESQWDELIRLYGQIAGQLTKPLIVNVTFPEDQIGTMIVEYSNGTFVSVPYPVSENEIVIRQENYIRVIEYTTAAWENVFGTYYLYVTPYQVGQNNNKFLLSVEGRVTDYGTSAGNENGYISNPYVIQIFKGDNGSVLVSASNAANGRVLIASTAILNGEGLNLNLENGGGSGAIQQKNFVYEGVGQTTTDGFKGTQPGDTVPGATATGENAVALGGLRYDTFTNPETLADNRAIDSTAQENFGLTPTSAEGNQSFAAGGSVHAKGDWSFAQGKESIAYQRCSNASGASRAGMTEAEFLAKYPNGVDREGKAYDKSFSFAHAEGCTTTATGERSHAEGDTTIADGYGSHAEGVRTKATKDGAHAEGTDTEASAICSHTEGRNTKATKDHAHAEGLNTQANGYHSHTEGDSTIADGAGAHSEGYQTKADGDNAHSEGGQTTASGSRSHAENTNTTASGDFSHAGGEWARAIAKGSFSHGYATRATKEYQACFGKNNEEKANALFIIGDGENTNSRRNAFAVLEDGRAQVRTQPTEDIDVVRKKELDKKADKFLTSRGIAVGDNLAGVTITLEYYNASVTFNNGAAISYDGTYFGLYGNGVSVDFWAMGSWITQIYTFPSNGDWTITSLNTVAEETVSRELTVDCEYNYNYIKEVEKNNSPIFRYDFFLEIVLTDGNLYEYNAVGYSSDPDLIYDENAATYTIEQSINLGLLPKNTTIPLSTIVSETNPFALLSVRTTRCILQFFQEDQAGLGMYNKTVDMSSSYILINGRTTV